MAAAPTCRRCGAVLRFVHMATGSRMPVDPIPDPAGTICARRVSFGNNQVVYVDGYTLKAGQPAPERWTTFTTHFTHCKDPNRAAPASDQPNPNRTRPDFLF